MTIKDLIKYQVNARNHQAGWSYFFQLKPFSILLYKHKKGDDSYKKYGCYMLRIYKGIANEIQFKTNLEDKLK